MTTLSTLRSQAHLQVAPAKTRPKPAKELAYSNARTEKYTAKMKDSISRDKNGQLVTKAICNKGFSGNSSILPRSNFGVTGQESSPQSLTAHSLNR